MADRPPARPGLLDHRVDEAIAEWAADGPSWLLLLAGPQTGKTTKACLQTVPWLLEAEPQLRITVVTYSHAWAQQLHNRIVTSAGHHGVTMPAGAVRVCGVGGPLPHRLFDVLIVDDPVKNRGDATSPTLQEHIWQWWQHEALTRLPPAPRVLVAATSYDPNDLPGRLSRRPGWRLLQPSPPRL